MKTARLLTLFAAALAVPCVALTAAHSAPVVDQNPAQVLPVDQTTVVQGVEVACTGMGETRQDARWQAFPVRVEFSNGKAEYLTDAEVRLTTDKGKPVLNVSCAAPWVLLKPKAGASYTVFAHLLSSAAKPRSAPFKTPTKGQIRVVIAFPDA
jgi:hypothetical protein